MSNKSRCYSRRDPRIERSHKLRNLPPRQLKRLRKTFGSGGSSRRWNWQGEIQSETNPEIEQAFGRERVQGRSRLRFSEIKYFRSAYARGIESTIRRNVVRDRDFSRGGEGD